MDKIRISLKEILMCITNAQNLVSPKLTNHNQQVAYLSFRIAEELNFTSEQKKDILLAGLVHDIGSLSAAERLELIETEPLTVNNHAFQGAKLLEGFKPLKKASKIIKYHHLPWDNGNNKIYNGEQVLLESHIIHLADRICTMLRTDSNIIGQLHTILSRVKEETGSLFEPNLVNSLDKLITYEYIWLDLVSIAPVSLLPESRTFSTLTLEMNDIVNLTHIFSKIIDFRSNFTASHSAGVAAVSEKLAQLVGFSSYECKMMLVAGYLHDLGKLAISKDILEKPAKLDDYEFSQIRSHTYYTYIVLAKIEQFQTINAWASYHHERLDGRGYPFHIKGDNLSFGSRIMAVADVFTAITEDRPYRAGMKEEQAKKVLNGMVDGNALDEKVVKILVENFTEINALREQAQQQAREDYSDFVLTVGQVRE